MRKSFTRLFGFLLLNVMMLFSYGLYAQEAQSTVELKAPTIAPCYNATNSYDAKVQTRDFIAMKSFDLTLNYDKSEFGVTSVTPVGALGGTFTATVDATAGTINLKWSNSTAVTIGNDAFADLFTVKFNVLNFPNNIGDNLFDSPLTWASTSKFYYGENFTGSYQVSTTAFTNGSLDVAVSYTDVQYTVTPASCDGGQAVVTVTSPVGTGMQYYFNGSTTASTSGIASVQAPSTAYVRVKDAAGCYSHLFSIPVTAPAPLVFNSVSTETPTCSGNYGEIQFSISGGTAPYTYWVVPAANISSVTTVIANQGTGASSLTQYKWSNFQVLKPSGTYKVAVSDANGCVDLTSMANWKDAVVGDAPAAITFDATTVTATCNGYTDGSIQVGNVAGGTASPTGSYMVSLNGTTWFAISSTTPTYTFSNLAGATYTVTVKDSKGCTTAKSVKVNQPNAITYVVTYQDVACGGTATPTGAINVGTPTGGTAGYTFAVAVSGTVTATTGPASGWVAAPGTIGSLSAGYYSIWVKDANGCVKPFANVDGSGNVLPIQQPTALAVATSADNAAAKEVACYGGSYTMTVTASGGVRPYYYSYDGGTTTTTSSSYFVGSGLTNSSYPVTVIVTDASGCTLTKTVSVDVASQLTASVAEGSVVSPTCPSGNDGRVNVLTNNGGTAPYTYSTNNVNWFDNNVLAIPEGTTALYVKDAAGCVASTTVTVATLTTNVIAATATNVTCNGAANGTINLTITSWVDMARTKQYLVATSATGTFSAFTPGTLNGVGQATPTTFDAGTYYVKVKDELGCISGTVSVTITQPAALGLTAAVTNATCFGLFDGTLTINTTGGTGRPEFAYANNIEALSSSSLVFQSVGTWSSTTHIGKQIVQVQRGTYYVKIRDVAPCGASSLIAGPFNVDGYKAITFTGTVAKTDITCNTANDGTITVPLAGVKGGKPEFDGAGNYTFTLAKPAGGTVTNTTGAFTGLTSGTYTITITDASSCSSSTVLPLQTIVRPSAIAITAVNVTHFSCKGSRDGIIEVTAGGGLVGGYQLAVNASVDGTIKESDWLNFGTTTSTTTKKYVATEPGTYYLYVRDANKCMGNTVSVTVLEPAALTLTGVVTDVTCAGAGQVQLSAGGGWSPTVTQTYTYKVGTTTYAGGLATGLNAGNYTASAMVNSGNYTVTTTVNSVNYQYVYPQIGCAASYSFTVKDLVAYKYSASVTNVKCLGGNDGTLTVNVLAGSAATNTVTGPEYYVQLTTTASPSLLAGSWTRTTSQKVTFAGLSHAIYSVWISNGTPTGYNQGPCLLPTGTETPTDGVFTKVASWEVNEPSTALTASATFNNDVTCNGGNDGKFTINAAGGSGSYTYAAKLSTIASGHILTPDPAASEFQSSAVFTVPVGTYVIWVKDSNGCIVGGEGSITAPRDEYRMQIRQPEKVSFSTAVAFTGCYASTGGKITVTPIVGAGAPYTYVVSGTDYSGATVSYTGTTTSTALASYDITGLVANKTTGSTATNVYTVTWTDKNGCSTSSPTVQIVQNKALAATMAKAAGAFLCPGDVTGVIEASATGGTGTYTYRLWRDGAAFTTTFGSIPSFIVQVGHTYKVEVKDDAGCSVFTNEQTINEPVGITATMQETTCYGDATASVVVKAVGETGRTFSVQYKANTAASYSTWQNFDSQIALSGFIFANSVVTQNFYYFNVKDNVGCTTSYTYSFVPTQNELKVTVAGVGATPTLTITGGIAPYSYQVGTASKTAIAGSVSGGSYGVTGLVDGTNTITVYDAHGCSKVVTYVGDLAAPTATYSPNGTTTDDNHPALVITFNENVAVGSGNITIKKKSDNSPAIAAIPASALTISGKTATITYAGGLDKNTDYYVVIDGGVVKDLAGNAFAGVTATNTWTFKTGNKFATPNDPEVNSSLKFKVYPNPFVDVVKIDSDEQLAKVVVTNIAGQVVKEVVNPGNSIQLDELRSGVYFITLYVDSEAVTTVKLLKR